MRETDTEARRERRERERAAGVDFNRMLRERLEAAQPYPEALAALEGDENGHEGKKGGGNDAA